MPVKELCCNGTFLFLVMAISSLYFVVSGLQYWITPYLTTVFDLPQKEVFVFYAVTCLTAPLIGVLVSICVFNKIGGGYKSRRAFCMCLAFGSMAVVAAFPVPFVNSAYTTFALLWLIFFFGAMILPPLVGMMLSTVP